jgi:hypothetical protein
MTTQQLTPLTESLMASLPARYSKFVTVLIGLFITYVSIYGWVWHLDPALIMIGTALGVYGVPNGAQPVLVQPLPPVAQQGVVDVPLPPDPPIAGGLPPVQQPLPVVDPARGAPPHA